MATEDDASARFRLFEIYRPLGLKIARRYFIDRSRGDIELGDLRQMAFAGLLEAISTYRPDIGVRFSAFAARRISGSILDGISKLSELREQISFRNRVRRERLKSLTAGKARPKPGQAIDLLAEVAVGLAISFMLDGSGLQTEEEHQPPQPTAYETIAWKEMTQRLAQEMDRLPPAERAVIRHHYINGLCFDQVATAMDLSKGRVSQLHRSALDHLRRRLGPAEKFNLQG